MWEAWQGRRSAPDFSYGGEALLTLWPSYVTQLPFYLVHPFNSDAAYRARFAAQWRAERAYYESAAYYAGDDGRYGLGAGPTARWCAGGIGYLADRMTNATGGDSATTQSCRTVSPYAVAGYLPASPGVIRGHLLALLAAGEMVEPVSGTDFYVLWRRSLLRTSPGRPDDPQVLCPSGAAPGYGDYACGITLVDFAAELFGLSTLWLGDEFFAENTDHWPLSS
jgi:hypothetical protein